MAVSCIKHEEWGQSGGDLLGVLEGGDLGVDLVMTMQGRTECIVGETVKYGSFLYQAGGRVVRGWTRFWAGAGWGQRE